MSRHYISRRGFLERAGWGTVASAWGSVLLAQNSTDEADGVDPEFFLKREELALRFHHPAPKRALSFGTWKGTPAAWREACRNKLAELLGLVMPVPHEARLVRSLQHAGVTIEAWIMQVSDDFSIPAYLLRPKELRYPGRAVMAIHGHGEVEPLVGLHDDYHHRMGLRLAEDGHLVLCPALRGFGVLGNVAHGDEAICLDYWTSHRGHQFTLISEAFLHGQTMIGQTTGDLLGWEDWLSRAHNVHHVDVCGISYGGDLAVTYPVFSKRARRLYASGTLGSFAAVFSRCYNAPAHCIPGILNWMDRSDIAGLNAPRPLRLHYGELDVPGRIADSEDYNNSASYNETVQQALDETRAIYKAFDAEQQVTMKVSSGSWHEMDIPDLLAFLAD